MSSAWVFQKGEDLATVGPEQASWYVGWYEPDGRRRKKSFGPGFKGKQRADRYRAKGEEGVGIHLPCRGQHKHTPSCHVSGFHDLRRAFATMNADKLTPDALQALMRHKSYLTTQVDITLSRQLDEAVAGLHVPDVLKAAAK
jgi:integrase